MGGGKMMLMPPAWSSSYVALIFAMWTIMMVAMMLPSAAPAILQVVSLAPSSAFQSLSGSRVKISLIKGNATPVASRGVRPQRAARSGGGAQMHLR
jgi:predicted metal-binding membrane protein